MAPISVSSVPNSFSALKWVGALRRISMKACWASCRRSRAPSKTARSISGSMVSPAASTRQQILKLLSLDSCANRGAQSRLLPASHARERHARKPRPVSVRSLCAQIWCRGAFGQHYYRLIRSPSIRNLPAMPVRAGIAKYFRHSELEISGSNFRPGDPQLQPLADWQDFVYHKSDMVGFMHNA